MQSDEPVVAGCAAAKTATLTVPTRVRIVADMSSSSRQSPCRDTPDVFEICERQIGLLRQISRLVWSSRHAKRVF